MIGVFATT
jgi:hypothetical protein